MIEQPAIDSPPPSDHSISAHPSPALQRPAAATPARPGPVLVRAATPDPHQGQTGTLSALQSLLSIIVIAIFIITFCIQPVRIPSASMEPSLLVGDFLFVNKQGATPGPSSWLLPETPIERGQIIVFHYPIDPSMNLIKRVIGVPGDHIKLRRGRVYVNDRILSEPYAMYLPSAPDSYRDNFPRLRSADPAVNSRWWIRMHSLIEDGELVVPPGDYFVLGDNRNDSEDSRSRRRRPRHGPCPRLASSSFQRRRRPRRLCPLGSNPANREIDFPPRRRPNRRYTGTCNLWRQASS
ncbi:MAG: signal peptidase I [Granulicella sp. SCN 62-9]|nr:MAG: signal peptidase I [Granulicella sp. SCN 62-9]